MMMPLPWHELSAATPEHGEIVEVAWGVNGRRAAVWQAPTPPGDVGIWLALDGQPFRPCGSVKAWRRTLPGWRWYLRALAPVPHGTRVMAGYPPGTEHSSSGVVHDSIVGTEAGWVDWVSGARLPDSFTSWAKRADV